MLSYDLSDGSKWRPFFSKAFPASNIDLARSVQRTKLSYPEPDHARAGEIEDELIEGLKREVRRWRAGTRNASHTSFNIEAGIKLKRLLPSLELLRGGTGEGRAGAMTLEQHKAEAERISTSRELNAVALNLPYTEDAAVYDRAKSTALHENKHSDVQFALAVYVHPYPCGVFSVWVYFGTLTPRS